MGGGGRDGRMRELIIAGSDEKGLCNVRVYTPAENSSFGPFHFIFSKLLRISSVRTYPILFISSMINGSSISDWIHL